MRDKGDVGYREGNVVGLEKEENGKYGECGMNDRLKDDGKVEKRIEDF